MFVSEATELAVGQQVWEQTLREAGAEGRLLPPHHPLTQLVARAGRRVAAAACAGEGGGYQAHMRNIKWEFAVVDSDQVNAFVAPGGKVVVFTGEGGGGRGRSRLREGSLRLWGKSTFYTN